MMQTKVTDLTENDLLKALQELLSKTAPSNFPEWSKLTELLYSAGKVDEGSTQKFVARMAMEHAMQLLTGASPEHGAQIMLSVGIAIGVMAAQNKLDRVALEALL